MPVKQSEQSGIAYSRNSSWESSSTPEVLTSAVGKVVDRLRTPISVNEVMSLEF